MIVSSIVYLLSYLRSLLFQSHLLVISFMYRLVKGSGYLAAYVKSSGNHGSFLTGSPLPFFVSQFSCTSIFLFLLSTQGWILKTKTVAATALNSGPKTQTRKPNPRTCWARRPVWPSRCFSSWSGSLTVNLRSAIACITTATLRLINTALRSRT